MPRFVCPRKATIAGFGHKVVFTPDVPIWVVPALVQTALSVGATPVDSLGSAKASVVDTGDVVVEAAAKLGEPGIVADGGVRNDPPVTGNDAAVFAAFDLLVERNSPDDFGAGNKPHVKSVERITEFDINMVERDMLWARYKARAGDE